MRLSSMADYAVVTMTAAASHCGTGLVGPHQGATDQSATGHPSAPGAGRRRPLNAGQLAEETGLPAPTVQKLVSRLVAAGLLRSSRGAGGGFKLARPAAAISLADIVEAVEGPIALTPCIHLGSHRSGSAGAGNPGGGNAGGVEHGRQDCTLEAACSVRPHWGPVNEALRSALAEVPLSRLVGAPAPASPPPVHAGLEAVQ